MSQQLVATSKPNAYSIFFRRVSEHQMLNLKPAGQVYPPPQAVTRAALGAPVLQGLTHGVEGR